MADYEWPYEITNIPDSLIRRLAQAITGRLYLGQKIHGDDWADLFADANGGEHLRRPVGHIDVVMKQKNKAYPWSVKTLKAQNPHRANAIRVISGRNSPTYSDGVSTDASEQELGNSVLRIWNERVQKAYKNYPIQYRISVLIRPMNYEQDTLKFVYFEKKSQMYEVEKYIWKKNSRNNLEGFDSEGRRFFTWQFHGSQFTIHYEVPNSAVKFCIKCPPIEDQSSLIKKAIKILKFDDSWIKIQR